MRKLWFIPALFILVSCGPEKKEESPLKPPSDEEVVEEEEKGIFESSKKTLPEEKEKEYKTEFDADGVYWLSEPLNFGKYAVNSFTLQKSEGATLTLEVEETADVIDLTSKKFTARQDTLFVQFAHKELGTITISGHFTENPWSEKVEENETVVLKAKIKTATEGDKRVEFTWNSL